MRELLLAVEGGGTNTRLILADADGAVLARECGGPASGLYIDPDLYAREFGGLLERIKACAKAAGGRVAAAGYGGPVRGALVRDHLRARLGRVEVVPVPESDIGLAYYGLRWGVTLVAGTGSSCRAVNERGEAHACGGAGPQFGDEGSGYWIGRAAVAAVLRARDGRGEPTRLAEQVLAFYGIRQLWDLFDLVERGGHIAGPKVAAFTPCVFEAARQGDAVARRICARAGRELGVLAAATVRRLAWDTPPVPFVMTGGVFHGGSLITRTLRRALRTASPGFRFYPAAPEPTEGIINYMRMRRGARLDACGRHQKGARV